MATGNSELTRLTAADLSAALVAGEVSAVEAAQAQLDRIGEVDLTETGVLEGACQRARHCRMTGLVAG